MAAREKSPLIESDVNQSLTITKLTNFRTSGETRTMVGKATTKANNHALSHIKRRSSTNPKLKMQITNDIRHDINKDMKNANTWFSYFFGTNAVLRILCFTSNVFKRSPRIKPTPLRCCLIHHLHGPKNVVSYPGSQRRDKACCQICKSLWVLSRFPSKEDSGPIGGTKFNRLILDGATSVLSSPTHRNSKRRQQQKCLASHPRLPLANQPYLRFPCPQPLGKNLFFDFTSTKERLQVNDIHPHLSLLR